MIKSQNVDLLGNYSPVRESNYLPTVTLNVVNAEAALEVDGDENALIFVTAVVPVMTIVFEGTVDGTNWIPIIAMPMQGVGNTIPSFAQPMLTDTYANTVTSRTYAVRCSQLQKIRLRVSAYTSGTIEVAIRSDANRSLHPNVNDRASSSLLLTGTAAIGVALTLTLPAVTGLRHYLDFIKISRFAGAVLTAAAAPVVVTTTNLPGAVAFSLPADAAAQGTIAETVLDFGGTGLAASAGGTATTIVMPATPNVIWRANCSYRLGY